MSNHNLVNGSYLNGMSEEEVVAHHEYCANLLILAEWLDSQDEHYMLSIDPSPVQGKGLNTIEDWEVVEGEMVGLGYYHSGSVTNKERVMAVLLLREILLDQGSL